MESLDDKHRRAGRIIRTLKKQFPDATCRLTYRSPFELLVKTILSAQSTDDRVNEVGRTLFDRYRTPDELAAAERELVEMMIQPTGLHRHKARHIQATARELVDHYDGQVPSDMDALTSLPGVGRKTANVIRGTLFGIPSVVVDTHVIRISNLLRWTKSRNAGHIETDIMKLLPERDWVRTAHLLSEHGRQTCVARRPKCVQCVIRQECPSANV